jgi:hypothetical protein
VQFAMPATSGGDTWTLLVDTAAGTATERRVMKSGETLLSCGRSLQLLVLESEAAALTAP